MASPATLPLATTAPTRAATPRTNSLSSQTSTTSVRTSARMLAASPAGRVSRAPRPQVDALRCSKRLALMVAVMYLLLPARALRLLPVEAEVEARLRAPALMALLLALMLPVSLPMGVWPWALMLFWLLEASSVCLYYNSICSSFCVSRGKIRLRYFGGSFANKVGLLSRGEMAGLVFC